jgi:hypothetical protein
MLIPGTAAYNTWHKMNNTKNILLKIHQGYPDDSEFDDTIELIDAFLHGQGPVDEVIARQGMSHLSMEEVVDHMNQRISHFYELGKA